MIAASYVLFVQQRYAATEKIGIGEVGRGGR